MYLVLSGNLNLVTILKSLCIGRGLGTLPYHYLGFIKYCNKLNSVGREKKNRRKNSLYSFKIKRHIEDKKIQHYDHEMTGQTRDSQSVCVKIATCHLFTIFVTITG